MYRRQGGKDLNIDWNCLIASRQLAASLKVLLNAASFCRREKTGGIDKQQKGKSGTLIYSKRSNFRAACRESITENLIFMNVLSYRLHFVVQLLRMEERNLGNLHIVNIPAKLVCTATHVHTSALSLSVNTWLKNHTVEHRSVLETGPLLFFTFSCNFWANNNPLKPHHIIEFIKQNLPWCSNFLE